MSDAFKYTSWRALREAIVECNAQRLAVEAQSALNAIRDRLQELVNESYDSCERQA